MLGSAKRENKFPPLGFCQDIFVCCLHPYTKQNNKIFVQTFRCAVALWKSWVCKYSIRFQVIKLKLLCETLKNEKWKVLAWYPNKTRRYCKPNPEWGNWRWTNFQMQVALLNVLFDEMVWEKSLPTWRSSLLPLWGVFLSIIFTEIN